MANPADTPDESRTIMRRDSISQYLKESLSSNVESPTEWVKGRGSDVPIGSTTKAPSQQSVTPGSSDRIVEYLRQRGPSTTLHIVQDLGLPLEDALHALDRLESFGFVAVDRTAKPPLVSLSE